MNQAWKQYQIDTSEFFKRLGLDAREECQVEGARGSHKVDVLVEGQYHGIHFKWVIECKSWKSNIPKEKVLALYSIVQDIGADRGFLLSETGFQSGAIRVASKTNITLSSLQDLSLATEEHLGDALIGKLSWRVHKALARLRAIKKEKYDDEYFPPTMEALGKIAFLDFAFADAINNEYPIIYHKENDITYTANNLDDLLSGTDKLITFAENWNPPE